MRTKNELLHIITTRGIATQKELEEMPLSKSYLRSCPVEVYEYLMQIRGSEVEDALNVPTEAQKRDIDAARFFGKASAGEVEGVLEVAAVFCRKHVDFAQTSHNANEVIAWLKENRRATPTLKDFEDAYTSLKFMNALELNEPEPVVSASQWLKEHSELRDKRPSPWGVRKIETAVNTFLSRPDYRGDSESAKLLIDAVQKSGQPVSTQLLDELFAKLVAEGKIQRDTGAVAEAGVTRMVNYR